MEIAKLLQEHHVIHDEEAKLDFMILGKDEVDTKGPEILDLIWNDYSNVEETTRLALTQGGQMPIEPSRKTEEIRGWETINQLVSGNGFYGLLTDPDKGGMVVAAVGGVDYTPTLDDFRKFQESGEKDWKYLHHYDCAQFDPIYRPIYEGAQKLGLLDHPVAQRAIINLIRGVSIKDPKYHRSAERIANLLPAIAAQAGWPIRYSIGDALNIISGKMLRNLGFTLAQTVDIAHVTNRHGIQPCLSLAEDPTYGTLFEMVKKEQHIDQGQGASSSGQGDDDSGRRLPDIVFDPALENHILNKKK